MDLSHGVNKDFDKLIAANLIADTPPASPSASARPSTLSTSIGSAPTPTSTAMPTACAGVAAPRFSSLTAAGWRAVKVAGDVTQPRSVILDPAGNLLMIQNGKGITASTIGPDGCLASTRTILTQRNLNHGLALSADGKTIYASSATSVWAWDYDAKNMTVGSTSKTIVVGMDSRGHVTRTLAFPPKHPNLLIVSHGSNDNFDWPASDIKVGRAAVKVFDLSDVPSGGYDYASGGYQMGWGLRNGVGLAFDADGMSVLTLLCCSSHIANG